jgi:GntR family transcriptional repressor for pyruvate dehydrogenase complex
MSRNHIQRPPKLHEVLSEKLQDVLHEKQLGPGSRLPPERELCEHFGVSRTVMRETVKVLIAQGVLKQIAGKGTFVSQNVATPLTNILSVFVRGNTSDGYANLFEARNVLEVEIAGLAAERASEKDIEYLAELNRSLAKLDRKIGHSDEALDRYNEIDFDFHLALAKCTRNNFFVLLITALSGAFKGTWSHMHHQPEIRRHGLEMNEKILDAIRAADPVAARHTTRENLTTFLADAESVQHADAPQAKTRANKGTNHFE